MRPTREGSLQRGRRKTRAISIQTTTSNTFQKRVAKNTEEISKSTEVSKEEYTATNNCKKRKVEKRSDIEG